MLLFPGVGINCVKPRTPTLLKAGHLTTRSEVKSIVKLCNRCLKTRASCQKLADRINLVGRWLSKPDFDLRPKRVGPFPKPTLNGFIAKPLGPRGRLDRCE